MPTKAAGSVHPWLPVTSCDARCVVAALPSAPDWLRPLWRLPAAVLLLLTLPVLVVPVPRANGLRRNYCRLLLRCLGVRVSVTGDPVRNLEGMLVVSNHTSWVDVLVIGAVLPGTFVARADLVDWPLLGWAARVMNVIGIDRADLRALPTVLAEVTRRLGAGRTVVVFPEGTTFCGPDRGRFRPAMFQAAIDAGKPVQPVHLGYRYPDGTPSTATAFLGEDAMWASLKRVARTSRTHAHVTVLPLHLPDAGRRELASRCEAALHRVAGTGVSGRSVRGKSVRGRAVEDVVTVDAG